MNAPAAPEIERLGEAALLVRWGDRIDAATNRRVQRVAARLRADAPAWLHDVVPAYASVAVHFDETRASAEVVRAFVAARLGDTSAPDVTPDAARVVELPVCYGGVHGPDLDDVASHAGLSPEAVVASHARGDYTVAMLGFSPGFPYLLGLDPALTTPRLATPRVRVPAGSVGIGGSQTGVYPDAGPGGWRLLGCTPLRLFDPHREPPSLLQPGDRVRVAPIDAARFEALRPPPSASPREDAGGDATIDVLSPGLQTTVQDLGRSGYRHLGVGLAGALDVYSTRVANRLVGNADDAPVLEIALAGPRLRFNRAARIAITGADVVARVGDHVLPGWRPIDLAAGTELVLGACVRGTRAMLAVTGGFAVPPVLGSAATDLRGGFGGFAGRALRAGDALALGAARPVARPAASGAAPSPANPAIAAWWLDPSPDLDFDTRRPIRVLAGRDATSPADALCATEWRIGAQGDRQGLRLEGAELATASAGDRVSEPVAPGTVQLPPDGRPIVLLGEAQTIGGYPRIAHVLAADLTRLVQRRAGEPVRFERVDAETAMRVACGQRARLARMTLALERRARDA